MRAFMGQSMSPWESGPVGPMMGRFNLAQAGEVACEPTPEGGQHCSDGTYLPPGCQKGEVEIQGQDPEGFPVLPVAAGIAVAGGAAALLLAGPRRLGRSLEETSPRAYDQLREIASDINEERSADAYNFQQAVEAKKRSQDLIFEIKDAEINLAEQERIWESTHRNAAELQAAQNQLTALQREHQAARARNQEFAQRVEINGQNISTLYRNAITIINGLPEDVRVEARRLIEPCFRPGLSGGIPTQPLNTGRF